MRLDRKGEMMIGTGVKVLIAVILGSLLLFGTHIILNETVMPSAEQRIAELFDATPEKQDNNNAEESAKTIYDNALIENKYARRLFVINKDLIEQKYGISVEDDDVQWLINGTDAGHRLYFANENGDPIPEGTTVQAVISVQKGSIKDNPNCCAILTICLD